MESGSAIFLFLFTIIIIIIIIAVYVIFFIGMSKVFNMDEYKNSSLLKNYLIAFTVLFAINIIIFSLGKNYTNLYMLISLVNLVLIYLIYFAAKEINEEIANYFLPLLFISSIFFGLLILLVLYALTFPSKYKILEEILEKNKFK